MTSAQAYMNDTTNQPNSQVDLNPDEAKASLGVATNLMDQIMKMHGQGQQSDQTGQLQQPDQAMQQPENTPMEEQQPEQQSEPQKIDDLENKIVTEISSLREEIKQMPKPDEESELADLRKQVEAALKQENDGK